MQSFHATFSINFHIIWFNVSGSTICINCFYPNEESSSHSSIIYVWSTYCRSKYALYHILFMTLFSLFRRVNWIIVNGIGAPGVIPPFALGLGTPLTTSAYGNAIPSLGAFALATTTGMGQSNPPSLRGISNVLLVSNLNEEVSYLMH